MEVLEEMAVLSTALNGSTKALNTNGIDTEIFHIGTKAIRGCMGCGVCHEKGECIDNSDAVNECLKLFEAADNLIGSPVHYASSSGMIASFMDRLFYVTSRFDKRFKVGATVVSCRRGGAKCYFYQLNKYFTIAQMPIVSSQYWNSIHGNTIEEVKQDFEANADNESIR
ncbi:MAG: flavodoxin family protein [Streptococcus salivarius]